MALTPLRRRFCKQLFYYEYFAAGLCLQIQDKREFTPKVRGRGVQAPTVIWSECPHAAIPASAAPEQAAWVHFYRAPALIEICQEKALIRWFGAPDSAFPAIK
jgi:hypothetical protein